MTIILKTEIAVNSVPWTFLSKDLFCVAKKLRSSASIEKGVFLYAELKKILCK